VRNLSLEREIVSRSARTGRVGWRIMRDGAMKAVRLCRGGDGHCAREQNSLRGLRAEQILEVDGPTLRFSRGVARAEWHGAGARDCHVERNWCNRWLGWWRWPWHAPLRRGGWSAKCVRATRLDERNGLYTGIVWGRSELWEARGARWTVVRGRCRFPLRESHAYGTLPGPALWTRWGPPMPLHPGTNALRRSAAFGVGRSGTGPSALRPSLRPPA